MRYQSHGLECDYLKLQEETRRRPFELRQKPTSEVRAETRSTPPSWVQSLACGTNSVLSPVALFPGFQPDLLISSQHSKSMTMPIDPVPFQDADLIYLRLFTGADHHPVMHPRRSHADLI